MKGALLPKFRTVSVINTPHTRVHVSTKLITLHEGTTHTPIRNLKA